MPDREHICTYTYLSVCEGELGGRTFSYDLAEGVVADDSDLVAGELLAQLVVRVRELGLVILGLGDGAGVFVAAVGTCGHDDIYRDLEIVKEQSVEFEDKSKERNGGGVRAPGVMERR